ncbi:MAG: protein kinase, partial [Myxococcales bacterium]|nr:protein kinase [Myxococcales bacterium]
MTDARVRPAVDIPSELELPARYEAVERLGKGGGGEVWSIRDRLTGETLALKTLSHTADERETEALVREAVALSGLEGLGVPRALRFGRLPRSKRPYLIRQLVEGTSLASFLADKPRGFEDAALSAVARVAEQLTALHRAGLLHGDVKPANIIVGARGEATLVDLGLVAAFRDKGEAPVGLTLLYAAPELLAGGAITVRAEVFALGATLRDVVEAIKPTVPADKVTRLNEIVARAVSPRPESRYPSVDELKNALALAAGLDEAGPNDGIVWPVVGLDEPARALVAHMDAMAAGTGVVLTGPEGSGRTTLLRRVAWALGIAGRSVAWLEVGQLPDPLRAIDLECGEASTVRPASAGWVVIVDDAQRLSGAAASRIAALREGGAKLLMVADAETPLIGPTLEVFSMTRLAEAAARDLVSRNIPSLDASVVDHILKRAGRWPGKLRTIVEALRGAPVVAPEDVDRLAPEVGPATLSSRGNQAHDHEPASLDTIRAALEKGHFEQAAELFQSRGDETSLEGKLLLARLCSNQGKWKVALDLLAGLDDVEEAGETLMAEHCLELARAHLRAGDNASSARHASAGLAQFGSMSAEAPRRVVVAVTELWAIGGLAKSFLGEHDRAQEWLERSALLARSLGDPRTLSIALGSLAFALQRTGKLEEAQVAYEEALENAQVAGDAGTVATTRLNLATVAKARGDLAKALVHLEA